VHVLRLLYNSSPPLSHTICAVSPASARAEDATGALPLHWATRNPDVSFEMIDLLLKAYPDAPTKTDNKVRV
jgi:ankyrin repeat protein